MKKVYSMNEARRASGIISPQFIFVLLAFIALLSIPAFASFNNKAVINFTETAGMQRNPEAIYYRLAHNSSAMTNCIGINVTNEADTVTLPFHSVAVDSNTCDIWFIKNVSALFNGTVANIHWDNNSPEVNLSVPLNQLYLFKEDCTDGNLFDNSTGYNWTSVIGGTGATAICTGGAIRKTSSGGASAYASGGFFWNNVTYEMDAYSNTAGFSGVMAYFLNNATSTSTANYTRYMVSTYGSNTLEFYVYLNGNVVAYNITAMTEGQKHWKFTKGEDGNNTVKFYNQSIYVDKFVSDGVNIEAGNIGFSIYAGTAEQYFFDNITVTPNNYYRNIGGFLTALGVVGNLTPATFTYLPPTPADSSLINYTTVSINVSIDSGFISVNSTLEFNGTNSTMNNTGNFTFYSTQSGLTDGNYVYRIYAYNILAELNLSPTRYFTVDATAPVITITSPNASFVNATIPIIFNIGDANPDTTTCYYNINGGTNYTIVDCLDTSVTITTNGTYTINIFVTDLAGNTASASATFTMDIPEPPPVPIIIPTFNFATLALMGIISLLILIAAAYIVYQMLVKSGEPVTIERVTTALIIVIIAIMIVIVVNAFMSL